MDSFCGQDRATYYRASWFDHCIIDARQRNRMDGIQGKDQTHTNRSHPHCS